MNIRNLLYIPLAALLACGTAEAPHEGHDHAHGGAAEHEAEAGKAPGAVQLDRGNTWAANAETTDGVRAMAALVGAFDPATGDGAVLNEELTAEFNQIFAKCTMTGEAHEQLHNFLAPVHQMLDGLGTAPSAQELAALKQYLDTYPHYFH